MSNATTTLVGRIQDLVLQGGSRKTLTPLQIIRSGLNPAARRVNAEALVASKSETISVLAGTQDYALPAGTTPFLRSSAILWGDERRQVVYRDNSFIAQLTGSGDPEYWTLWGEGMRIGPRPRSNGTLYVDAHGGPPPCTESDTPAVVDELRFPSDAEDAAVFEAARILCVIVGEDARGTKYERMAMERMAALRRRLAPDDDEPAEKQVPSAVADGLLDY